MKSRRIIRVLLFLLFAVLALAVWGCANSGDDDDDSGSDDDAADDDAADDDDNDQSDDDSGDDTAGGTIVLNEIDCHGRDWVELVNTSAAEIDISGWYVADDLTEDGHQYEVPAGSVVQPDEHYVIKQEEDLEEGFTFGLKCAEDTVYLLDSSMNVMAQETIGEVPDGSTWGRLPDVTGDWQETSPTQGETNQEPYSSSSTFFNPLTINTVRITLSDGAVTSLTNEPYEFVEGQIQVVSGEVTSDLLTVGVRLKSGESFQPITGKAAFKIKINEYDTTARLFGLKGFSLNNMIDDPTMMHETLAYTIFRGIGIPAIRAGYAWVLVNGEARGLYATIENYDDVFAAFQFENTSHVYEGTADLDSTHVGQIDVDEGDESDRQDLLTLVDVLNNTADDSWTAAVAALFDFDLFLDLWAVENYIGQTDGYAQAANNYFLHSDNDGYFTMMPWGTDRAFTDKPAFPSGTSIVCSRCLGISGCADLYDTALPTIVAAIENLDPDTLITEIDSTIASHVQDDEYAQYTYAEYQAAVAGLREYLADRPDEASAI
ncbi:MAG: hypothetical protein GX444_00730 [Myxococcales bacterium]|nr:hypothetical protein [Myxococcales bacterium]